MSTIANKRKLNEDVLDASCEKWKKSLIQKDTNEESNEELEEELEELEERLILKLSKNLN